MNKFFAMISTIKKIFLTSTKNIAAQNFFYDINEEQKVEDIFSELESIYSIAFNKLTKDEKFFELTKEDLYHISHFIAVQDLRTSKFRKKVRDAANWFVENEGLDGAEDDVRTFIEKNAEEEGAKRLQLLTIGGASTDFAETLLTEYKWILFVNQTDIPFWTSDNPFTRYNFLSPGKYGDFGLGGAGAQGHLPINPDVSLAIVDPEVYRRYPDRVELENEDNVIRRNRLQVEQSERQIYSDIDNFELAENIVSENPDLADPHKNHYEDKYKGHFAERMSSEE